jgi:hypothetical protein
MELFADLSPGDRGAFASGEKDALSGRRGFWEMMFILPRANDE